jgi:hypothetical protein
VAEVCKAIELKLNVGILEAKTARDIEPTWARSWRLCSMTSPNTKTAHDVHKTSPSPAPRWLSHQPPFTGAIEAAVSVLLTIVFGVVAAQCNLLSPTAAKEVSRLCVRMFLPALLIYKIGDNLTLDTGVRYVPIVGMPSVCPINILQRY